MRHSCSLTLCDTIQTDYPAVLDKSGGPGYWDDCHAPGVDRIQEDSYCIIMLTYAVSLIILRFQTSLLTTGMVNFLNSIIKWSGED